MTFVKNNDFGQAIYYIEIDLSKYDYIIFNGKDNGQNKQTADLNLYDLGENNQYYMEWNSEKGDHVVTTYYSEN